jgi:exopolysaccharide production protein ExoZ
LNWLTQKFELSRGGGAHNVRPMEGLRGFAVFLVFLVHFVVQMEPWLTQGTPFFAFTSALFAIGNVGVDLFFVLSGYLIYGSLMSRRQPFLRFMSRRVERIYPTFAVMFAAYVALSFMFPAESKIPSPPGAGLVYLLQNFLLLPGIFPVKPMIVVAWTLSYEMFYYLAIPLVVGLFGLRGRGPVWRMVFFVAIAAALAAWCAANGGPVRLIMFISGVVLFEAMNRFPAWSPSSAAGLVALGVGLLSTLLPWNGNAGIALKICILFVTFAVLCWVCFRTPLSWLPRTFSWTPLRWLGNMSYSYYLIHGLALKFGFLVLAKLVMPAAHGAWLFWALLPPMFMLSLIPSALLFLCIERPFSLAPKRKAGGGTPAAPGVAQLDAAAARSRP